MEENSKEFLNLQEKDILAKQLAILTQLHDGLITKKVVMQKLEELELPYNVAHRLIYYTRISPRNKRAQVLSRAANILAKYLLESESTSDTLEKLTKKAKISQKDAMEVLNSIRKVAFSLPPLIMPIKEEGEHELLKRS